MMATNTERARARFAAKRARGECYNCAEPAVAGKARCAKHAEANRERLRKWYAENPEAKRESVRKHREANPEAHRERVRKWRAANPEASRAHYAANKAAYYARDAQRRAAKLLRSPLWSRTTSHRARVRELYEDAALFSQYFIGGPFVVDHCIALQGETVSGLHLENNLRVIPAKLNASKSNRSLDVNADAPDAWRDPAPVFERVAVRRTRIERGVWTSDDHSPIFTE